MVDLKSKLRAKFPRRHSGIPSLTSDKSGKSSKSDASSRTASRPQSECAATSPTGGGFFEAAAASILASVSAGAVVNNLQARDKLKQAANQETGAGGVAQSKTTTDVTHAGNGCNGHDANAAGPGTELDEDAANATMTRSADAANNSSGTGPGTTASAAKNAASTSSPPHPRAATAAGTAPALHLPQHAADATSDSACSLGDGFVDRRISAASRVSALSSINENTDVSSKFTTDSDSTAHDPDPNSAAAATHAVRRIRLQDPPVSFDSSTPAPAPAPAPTPAPAPAPPPTPRPHNPAALLGDDLRAPDSASASRPAAPPRRQSLLPSRQTTLIRTLLSTGQPDGTELAAVEQLLPISATMVTRKIWVKRPGGSPTLVTINEEDLVDDVRDMILRKYANSLGRQFDAPDLMLRIVPREQQRHERFLGPEEPMARTLDAYFPGGQTVEEALVIDSPQRRTPRASPRAGPPHALHMTSVFSEDGRPAETGTDYFGPSAVANIPVAVAVAGPSVNGGAHSISVLSTGQVPQIPSPGGTKSRTYRERPDRPRLGRQHTSSPTILNVMNSSGQAATLAVGPATAAATTGAGAAAALSAATTTLGAAGPTGTQQQQISENAPLARTHSDSPDLPNGGPAHPLPAATAHTAPPAPPLPTPPAPETTTPLSLPARTATPPPRPASPRPSAATLAARAKKKKADTPALPAGLMLNGGVPPINVLIVEDNIINLRLLEAFIKRLKVRWATAMNGREAVEKWRGGGFHLVLMDIQLPIMNGLEATREIRRLERVNSIGAFSSAPSGIIYPKGRKPKGADREPEKPQKEVVPIQSTEDDILKNRELFKSPVIIVALTASSLQSDRHDALAAGCNDFLTKPVTYVWLERKVMEWGCMQALIDFDGWRKWKSYSSNPEEEAAKKSRAKKNRSSVTTSSVDSKVS